MEKMTKEGIRGRILVRSWNSEEERHDEDEEDGKTYTYRRTEFHMVDLKEDGELELHRDILPSLLSRTARGMMLSVGTSIFVVGGVSCSVDESLASLKPPPERRHLYYKGGARINLNQAKAERDGEVWQWHPVSLQVNKYNAFLPVCAALSGKLYSFGLRTLEPEVFDPCVGDWKLLRLPSHLVGREPSIPVVADPSNRRILIHSAPALYAFYPPEDDSDEGNWECLSPNFFPWVEVVAVAGDLIFLYDFHFGPSLVCVYDTSSGNWLDVVWSTPFLGNVMVTNLQFSSLFSLGNGFMCFASFASQPPPLNTTIIVFFKFRALRCPNTTAIILAPISLHQKTLESTSVVLDFLPLCQEAFVDYY